MSKRKILSLPLDKDEVSTTEINLDVLPTYLPNSKRHQSKPVEAGSSNGITQNQLQLLDDENNPKFESIQINQAEQQKNLNETKNDAAEQNPNYHADKNKKTQARVPVFGTNILLETEEDIKKWIEERKKNYPTNKKIQEKIERQRSLQRQENSSTVKDINKTSRKGAYENSNCNIKNSKNSRTISLIPQSNNKNLQNGRVRDFQGIRVFIPSRFNNTFITNKEKKNFSNRLNARDNVDINNKILNFIEDLVDNNLFDMIDAPKKIKNML